MHTSLVFIFIIFLLVPLSPQAQHVPTPARVPYTNPWLAQAPPVFDVEAHFDAMSDYVDEATKPGEDEEETPEDETFEPRLLIDNKTILDYNNPLMLPFASDFSSRFDYLYLLLRFL